MIGSSHQIAELLDHSWNKSSVMMIVVSSAGPAGQGTPGARAATQAKGTVMLKSLSTSLVARGILAVEQLSADQAGLIAVGEPTIGEITSELQEALRS
jgi:hypothetical protein